MANNYVQIRCGTAPKGMTIGREYSFSVGKEDEKISPEDMLNFIEGVLDKAFEEKFGVVSSI